jgi:hypothetical protein
MRRDRAGRAWRGLLAAAFATFVASFSHALADGSPAPLLGVLLAFAIAAPVCVLLAGRRFSWVRLSIAVAASQFAFHGLLLVGVGIDTGAGFVPAAGTHAHGVAAVAATGASPAAVHGHADLAMWLAHAGAALVTILAFGWGERAFRMLLDLAGWRIAARFADWRPTPVAVRLPAPVERAFAPHPVRLLSPVWRRGPPIAA